MSRLGALIPLYYAPDIDQSWDVNPGVLNGICNYVPTKRGTYANFANGPNQTQTDAGSWAVATYGTPVTGYVFKAVSGAAGTARMFVCSTGSKRRIIELASSATVTDRSKGGTDYSASVTQWTMAAAGNAILACNGVDAMQVSTSGIFSDLGGGAPTGAQCLATNLQFVLAGNKGDGTNEDSVGWSALANYASWTPSLATQAGNVRLLDTPGPIRALVSLRDSVVVYKDDSIYVGDYIGDTVNGVLWGFRLVSDKVGCASIHGVAVLNNVHYFLHRTGVYSFDGAQVVNIGKAVHKEILRLGASFAGLSGAQSAIDELEGIIYFGFPDRYSSTTNVRISFILMLNVNTGRWGGCMGADGGITHTDERATWHENAPAAQLFYAFMHSTVGDLMQWEANGTWTLGDGFGSAPVCIGNPSPATGNAVLRIPQYNAAVASSVAASTIRSGWLTIGPRVNWLRRVWPRLLYFGTQTATPSANFYHLRQESATASVPPVPAVGTAVSPVPAWNASDYAFDGSGQGAADRCEQFAWTFAGPNEFGGVWLDLDKKGEN